MFLVTIFCVSAEGAFCTPCDETHEEGLGQHFLQNKRKAFTTKHQAAYTERLQGQHRLLQRLLSCCEAYCPDDYLRAAYGQASCTKEELLSDVVALIFAGNNIRYDHQSEMYMLFFEPWGADFQEGDGRQTFMYLLNYDYRFASYSLPLQTYYLYEQGCLEALQGTVAVFRQVVGYRDGAYQWNISMEDLDFLLEFKNTVITQKELLTAKEYNARPQDFSGKKVCDWHVAVVKESLKLVPEGRIVLAGGCELMEKVANFTQGVYLNGIILRALRNYHDCLCTDEFLIRFLPTFVTTEKKKVLYNTIISLRIHRHANIEHDPEKNTFTLIPGRRFVQYGDWECALWRMLDDKKYHKCGQLLLRLYLSGAGYNPPMHTKVNHIKTIKLFSLGVDHKNILSKNVSKGSVELSNSKRRQTLWNIVLGDGGVKDVDYYKNHPDVMGGVSGADLTFLREAWDIYDQKLRYSDYVVTQDEEALKELLEKNANGISIEEVFRFFRMKLAKDVVVWRVVLDLMRHGYAQNVHYYQGQFYWAKNEAPFYWTQNGLFDSCCKIAQLEYYYSSVCFFLYKIGYCCVSPAQIKKIIDILYITERVPLIWQNSTTRAWHDVIAQKTTVNHLSIGVKQDVQGLLNLEKQGFLELIKKEKKVNLTEVLRACGGLCDSRADGLYEEQENHCQLGKRVLAQDAQPADRIKRLCVAAQPETPDFLGGCNATL